MANELTPQAWDQIDANLSTPPATPTPDAAPARSMVGAFSPQQWDQVDTAQALTPAPVQPTESSLAGAPPQPYRSLRTPPTYQPRTFQNPDEAATTEEPEGAIQQLATPVINFPSNVAKLEGASFAGTRGAVSDIAEKVAGLPAQQENPWRNLQAAVYQEPLPIDEMEKEPGWSGALAKVSHMGLDIIPRIYAMRGMGAAGMGPASSGAVAFGASEQGKIDPLGAALGALFPGVSEVGRTVADSLTQKLIDNGVMSAKNKFVRNLAAEIGSVGAIQSVNEALQSPKLYQLYQKDPGEFWKQIAADTAGSAAFVLSSAPEWAGQPGPWSDAFRTAVEKTYTPEQLKDIMVRSQRAAAGEEGVTVTPEEAEVARFVAGTAKPRQTVRGGVTVTTSEPWAKSPFWQKFFNLKPPITTFQANTPEAEEGVANANSEPSTVGETQAGQAEGVSPVPEGGAGPVQRPAQTGPPKELPPAPGPVSPPPAPQPPTPPIQPTPQPPIETPEQEKARVMPERIQAGIDPQNLRVMVQHVPGHPAGGVVQVDEMHPQLGNTFSSNPDEMRAAGYNMPDTRTMLHLPQGKYTLPQAYAELQKQSMAQKPEEKQFKGQTVVVENKAGTIRANKEGQQPWAVTMPVDYGYMKGTVGADGEPVDLYMGPHESSDKVFVFDQKHPTKGHFDETKAFAGFDHPAEAAQAFHEAFSDKSAAQRFGGAREMSWDEFVKWANSKAAKKPVSGPSLRPTKPAKEKQPWQSDIESTDVKKPEDFQKIADTYWAGKPNPTKTFTYLLSHYVTQSIEWRGNSGRAKAWKLVPADQWEGETFTQQQLYAKWDKKEGQRGDETGLKVIYKGQPYVLSRPVYFEHKWQNPHAMPWPKFLTDYWAGSKMGEAGTAFTPERLRLAGLTQNEVVTAIEDALERGTPEEFILNASKYTATDLAYRDITQYPEGGLAERHAEDMARQQKRETKPEKPATKPPEVGTKPEKSETVALPENATVGSIIRDRVLALPVVQRALNQGEQTAMEELRVNVRKEMGKLAVEIAEKRLPGKPPHAATWAEDYNNKKPLDLARMIYEYAARKGLIEAEPPTPPAPTERKASDVADLSDDDLKAILDEAQGDQSQDKYEQQVKGKTAPKQPEAPKLTQKPAPKQLPEKWTPADVDYFIKEVEGGRMVFWGGNDAGLPEFQSIPKLEHMGYGLFKAKGPGYEITVDGGGAMQRTDSGISYTVAHVNGNYPYDKEKVLATLRAMKGGAETKKPKGQSLRGPKQKAEEITPAEQETVEGILEAAQMLRDANSGEAAVRDYVKKAKDEFDDKLTIAGLKELRDTLEEWFPKTKQSLRAPPIENERAPKHQPPPASPNERTAAEIAAEAAKLGVSGAAEALKGLHDLFGGGTRLGTGPSFDEESYQKAKPHFEKAYEDFVKAGRTLKDFFKFIFEQFGARIRPYLERFIKDLRARAKGENETTSTSPRGPVGSESTDVAEGQPTGPPTGPNEQPGQPEGGTPNGGPISKPGAVPSPELGSAPAPGPGTGTGGTVPAGSNAPGRPNAPERPGVGSSPEVSFGRDTEPGQNLRIQPDDKVTPDGRTARVQANLKAIALSDRIAEENRLATPEEKRVIAQFSGWGDTFQVFGRVPITSYKTASDVYEDEKRGMQLYNILWNADDRERYEKWKKQYGKAYDILSKALSPAEWDAAELSSLNAHYTSQEVIRDGLWKIAERLGWKGGVAVEPSAGIGSIIGLTPDRYAGKVHWIGVELDKKTGQMLKQLYPASDIQNTAFEKSQRTENNSADMVMSNFPFGDIDVVDPKHPDYDGWSLHNYFTARSIDVVKPGGLVVAITSRFTMDGAKGQKMRNWLAERADLLGAIRLPQTAFKESAGTEVVTDILIFRKKSGLGSLNTERFAGIAQVSIPKELTKPQGKNETDEQYAERIKRVPMVNEYFVAHPEMVLGKHSLRGKMYGKEGTYTVEPSDVPFEKQLADAIAQLPANVANTEEDAIESSERAAEVQTVAGEKPDRYIVKDGKVYQVDDQGRLNDAKLGAAGTAAAKKLIGVRDEVTKLIALELEETSTDDDLAAQRAVLNKVYDAFVKSRGAVNDRKNNIIDDDPEWPLVASLEDEVREPVEVTVKGKKITKYVMSYVKGGILLKRANFPRTEPTKADSLADGIAISQNYRGGIDPKFIGKLMGISPEDVRRQAVEQMLAFDNPGTGLLEPPDQYLSGFVKDKLVAAEMAAKGNPDYQRNVDALKKVQPVDLPAEKIFFKLGSNWITSEQVKRFLQQVMGVDCSVQFVRAGDETSWLVGDPKNTSTANLQTFAAGGNPDAGLDATPGHELVKDCLNLKLTEIQQTIRTRDGTQTIKYPKETAAARDMQTQIQEAFRNWALKEPAEASEIEKTYNQFFNGVVQRTYPVPTFDRFPGASDAVLLTDWQKRAAMRGVHEGTLDAHTVGTGKTYTLITTAMEMRRLKTARKPMIVVQNSTLTQFANSFRKLYPTANILVGNEKKTKGDLRKKFVAMATTRDWDSVVVPMSFFERIENDPQREADYVAEQVQALEDSIREAEGDKYTPGGRPSTALGKQLLRVLRRYENRMDRALQRMRDRKDDLITFEGMGVDALLVDEAHNFKRGDFHTKMDKIKGLDTNGSDRSMDFLMKTMWVQQRSPDRNVVLATGTPISNTLAELWTMLRYIRPNLLKNFKVDTFDDFIGTFATPVATTEETPTGGFAQVLRLAKYVNGPEIGQLWKAAADVYVMSREDFEKQGRKVPKLTTGAPQEVVLERSDAVGNFINFLRDWRLWWENQDGQVKAETSYVPILQYGLARKAAIDLRLVNPTWPDDPNSKVNYVINKVVNQWKNSAEVDGTQLLFSALYQSHDPKKRWLNEDLHLANPLYGLPAYNLFQDIKDKLIARGVPENEIADFTTMNEAQRFAAAEQVKLGKIRIALGTTETLGTGLNLQDHGVAVHHLDPQFRPMDFEQRNGRFIRQGNQNDLVDIWVYGMKRTLDSTLYQLMLIKQKFVAQMMTADSMSREFEDPSDESTMSFQAMSAAFSGNPMFAQRFGLENDVRRLEILEEDYNRKRMDTRRSLVEVNEGEQKYADATKDLFAAKAALKAAFPENVITKVTYKNQTAEGDEAKKLLESVFEEPFASIEQALNEEFASGELAKSREGDIQKFNEDKYGNRADVTRTRNRKVTINGVTVALNFWEDADFPALAQGRLELKGRHGKWTIEGMHSAAWSEGKPWYVSQTDIYGHASSSAGFQSSLWNAIKNVEDKTTQVDAGKKRFAKMSGDLREQLEKPFEGANRLVEQRQKLAEVLQALQQSGADIAAQQPPTIDDIVKNHPQLAYLTRQVAAENSEAVVKRMTDEDNKKARETYFMNVQGKFVPVKGAKAVKLTGYDWMDTFSFEDKRKDAPPEVKDNPWIISETSTGMRLASGPTLAAAKKKAEENLGTLGEEKIKATLNKTVMKSGLSPRLLAMDAGDKALLEKFAPGELVTFGWDGDKYTGPVKAISQGNATLGVEVDRGKTMAVPMRLVQRATPEEQEVYQKQQAPAEESPEDLQPPEEQASIDDGKKAFQESVRRPDLNAANVEEFRKLVNDPNSGLSPEQASLITAFLDSPLGAMLDGLRFRIADTLRGGWQGSYFQKVAELARGADPLTGPHELLHRIWEILPVDLKNEFARLRDEALKAMLKEAQGLGQQVRASIIAHLLANPSSGARDFLRRNYPSTMRGELYPFSSPEEFFTHSASDRFKQRTGSIVEGFWDRVKRLIQSFIEAIKRGLGIGKEDVLDKVLSGNFTPADEESAAGAETPRERQGAQVPKEPEDEGLEPGMPTVRTKVFGTDDFVRGREQITGKSTADSAAYAKSILTKAGLQAVQDPSGLWSIVDTGFEQNAEGKKLLALLKQEIATKNEPGKAGDLLANLLNTVVFNFKTGGLDNMERPLREDLYDAAQSDRSQRGLALGALSMTKPDLSFVSQNLDVVLHRIYADSFGGDGAVAAIMGRIMSAFREYFTDDEIRNALKGKPEFAALVNKVIAMNARDEGGRVYRKAQGLLKPKAKKKLSMLEADARVQEAVDQIIENAKALGIEPKKSPNKPLSPIERLLLMVTPETGAKIDKLIADAVEQGQRNAGIKASIKEAKSPDEVEDLQARFAAGEEPDPDMIEKGLEMPEFAHWKALRDDLLGYNPTTLKLVHDLLRSDFKGVKVGQAEPKPLDTRIKLDQLGQLPDSEVQRVLNAYLTNIESRINLAKADPGTQQRVSNMIRDEVTKQLEAARERVRSIMFAEPKAKGTAPTAEEQMAKMVNAKLFSDPKLDIPGMVQRVAAKSRMQALTPTVTDLVKTVLNTPQYSQAALGEAFAEEMVERLGVSPQDAQKAKNVFLEAFSIPFQQAKAKALKKAQESLTPKEVTALKPDKAFWKRLEELVNSGLFDSGTLLRAIAKARGWTTPTDQMVAHARDLVQREQKLRELTPAERQDIESDPTITDKAAAVARAEGEKEAVTLEPRTKLIKQMGVMWARMTKPISWVHWWETRQNIAQAAQEYGMANVLFKLGFMFFRIETHIATQLVAHSLTRPVGAALERWRLDKARGKDGRLWNDLGEAFGDHWTEVVRSLGGALRTARAAWAGRVEARNVDRLMSGIQALDRMLDKAREYRANGDNVRAVILYTLAFPKLALRVLGAVDAFQGGEIERPELRHEVRSQLREMGKSPAEIEAVIGNLFTGLKAKMTAARIDAAASLRRSGVEPTEKQIAEAADELLRQRLHDEIAAQGMSADDFRQRVSLLQRREAWQVRVEHGLGGVVAGVARGVQGLAHRAGVPLPMANFANAIGTGINYMLLWTPFYRTVGWGPKDKVSPWFSSERDRYQADARAAIGTTIGSVLALLAALGLINVVLPKKRTKEENQELIAQGHKLGTVEFPVGDGFIPFSLAVGPFSMMAPYLTVGGAIRDKILEREAAQDKLNKQAAEQGLRPGTIRPMDTGDWLTIAANAAWGALQANKTIGGLTGSFVEAGMPAVTKAAAAQVSPYVPGLPAYQEVSRMAGVTMDQSLASFWDFMVPLPTSQARAVNVLGDPVKTPDDLQRVIQTMTAGTFPGIVHPDSGTSNAYQALLASGYRPPSINPNQGYAINGEFRPMTDQELANYTQQRGEQFKQQLAGIGSNPDPKDVQAAYRTANDNALQSVGVDTGSKATVAPSGASVGQNPVASGGLPARPKTSGGVGRAAGLGRSGHSLGSSGRGNYSGPSLRRPPMSGARQAGRARYHGPSLRTNRVGGSGGSGIRRGIGAPRRGSIRVR